MTSRFLVVGGLICPSVDQSGQLVLVVGGGGSLEHFGYSGLQDILIFKINLTFFFLKPNEMAAMRSGRFTLKERMVLDSWISLFWGIEVFL